MLHATIRNRVRDVLMDIGFKQYFHKNRHGANMLLLHGIDDCGSTAYNSRFISSTRFDALLTYFKQHFHIATLQDFCLGNYPKNKQTITLTFDDGLSNNYYKALPLLEKHQVPASFFITGIRQHQQYYLWTDFIDLFLHNRNNIVLQGIRYSKNKKGVFASDNGTALKDFLKAQPFTVINAAIQELTENYAFDINQFATDYFLQMTEAEIQQLASHPLATIGSHGMHHTDLTKIALWDAEHQLTASKAFLEQVTGKTIDAFAFPFDVCNAELVDMARRAGYTYILPHSVQQHTDRPLQRFGINPYISFNNQLHFIYKGNYA